MKYLPIALFVFGVALIIGGAFANESVNRIKDTLENASLRDSLYNLSIFFYVLGGLFGVGGIISFVALNNKL
jgi:hypothetical protein